MGDVRRALLATSGNGDRAVDYLMGGGGGIGDEEDGDDEDNPAVDPFEELRNHPNFAELRAMVLRDPSMLSQILGAISESHPDLAEAIENNPEEFMAFLEEDADEENDPVDVMLSALDEETLQSLGAAGGLGEGVDLSTSEREAVERL